MKTIIVIAGLLALAGCATPVRVSTAELMPAEEAKISIGKSKAESVELIKKLMADRGLKVKAVAPTKDNKAEYFVFSGPRQTIGTEKSVATVGSWISARFESEGKGTKIKFLGKPNLGGQELCSDADVQLADAEYWCRDTSISKSSPYYAQVSGREEVQLIRGLITELKVQEVK